MTTDHFDKVKLTSELLVKYKEYYEALKQERPFEESTKLYLEIKEIEKQLKELPDEENS